MESLSLTEIFNKKRICVKRKARTKLIDGSIISMEWVIINASLYVITLFAYWRKRKLVDMYFVILALYTVTAVLCVVNFNETPQRWSGISLIPFLYMYAVLMVFFLPIQKLNLRKCSWCMEDNSSLRFLATFFMVCSIISIAINITDTIERVQSGEWGLLRSQLYADAADIALYSSPFDRLLKNIVSYLSPFAITYLFFLLTQRKPPVLLTFFLALVLVFSDFISASAVASRGMIVFFLIKLLIAYLLFRNRIPQYRNKYIYVWGAAVFVLLIIYMITVSISRFGDDTSDSITDYLGHSMLAFNNDVFGKVHTFANGKMFFQWFIDLFGGNSVYDQAKAGATHGTAFYTIVGGVYFDFGFIGTIIAAILIAIIMFKFFGKRNLSLADTVIIIFYCSRLADGCAVLGRGGAITWLMAFVVYYIVKRLEHNKKHFY